MSRKGRIEKVSLKTKDTYELEFAIDAESEPRALNILADVFGENIKPKGATLYLLRIALL